MRLEAALMKARSRRIFMCCFSKTVCNNKIVITVNQYRLEPTYFFVIILYLRFLMITIAVSEPNPTSAKGIIGA